MRLPSLPPYLSTLPGAEQRLRALRVLAVSGLVLLLRPFWPLSWLPGWVVGALLLWTIGELVLWRKRSSKDMNVLLEARRTEGVWLGRSWGTGPYLAQASHGERFAAAHVT